MKIIYLTLVDITQPTGPGTNELECIEALEKCRKEDVEIYFLFPNFPANISVPRNKLINYAIEEKKYILGTHWIWQWQYLSRFRKIIESIGLDNKSLVMIRPEPSGKLNLLTVWLYINKVKFGYRHVQDQIQSVSFKNFIRFIANKTFKWSLNVANYVDTTQRKCYEHIKTVRKSDVFIVGNAVNLNRFRCLNKVEARQQTNLPIHKYLVGYIGGVPLDRGAGQLINAAHEIIKQIPEVHFLIVGDSKFKNESHVQKMNMAISKKGLEPYFTVTGYLDYSEILPYFNSLDIGLALVSSDEVLKKGNSSQKIYQYLATGVPVIVPKNTHNDLVSKGVAYQIVPEQSQELVDTISLIRQNQLDRVSIRNVAEDYSVEKRAQTQLKQWEKVIES